MAEGMISKRMFNTWLFPENGLYIVSIIVNFDLFSGGMSLWERAQGPALPSKEKGW